MPSNKKRRIDEESMEVDDAAHGSAQNGETNRGQDGVVNDDIDHISDDEEGGVRIGDIYIPPAPKPALTFDATGPRLIITKIVNENFKSYAGVQTLGPFHKSFTAIIGPNGSGKSNVIDSMLFVFGYRATKIRSKKISVLLHSSSKFPNITSACVAVHFCEIIDGEGEEFTVVPNSEIVVSRTAFKDNSSFYTLNGKRVQFKEVAKMLRSHGIDLDHNRFLILQGEVEQIAMMKPKGQTEHEAGMLEYLEDIIGTSRYKEPIEKLMVKVEELSEARKEKLNRVRLVEQEKQKLEQPMREAVELMNLTNVTLRTRNTLLQKYIHETNKMMKKKVKDMEELTNNLKAIEEKLQKLQEELGEKKQVLDTGSQKYNNLQKKKQEITEKLKSVKTKSVTVQSDIKLANKRKKNIEQHLEQQKGKLIELELVPEKNKRDIEDCKKLLEKHKESKSQAVEEHETLMAVVRSKTEGLQETKDKLQAKCSDLKNIVNKENDCFVLAESELNLYLTTEQKETKHLEELKENCEKAVQDLNEKKSKEAELLATLPSDEKQLSASQKQLEELRREESAVSNEVRSLRGKLEESKQTMSANRSQSRVLDSLMKEKRNGNLPGVFGRLGDLGGINERYDVAISTCCGALDYVIVDTVETGQACLEYLKRHDIGRVTCIALEKQEHLKQIYQRKVQFPENIPRLFDLVEVKDPRVLPAFYFALRDTLVATDMTQASRIAYGATRYRVVTLGGDVIETSGTMTGGGNTVTRGRMSSSVQQDTSEQDTKAVKAQEQKLAGLEQRLISLRSQLSSLEDTVVSLERKVTNGRKMKQRLDMEMKNLSKQVPILKNRIKEQEKKVASSKVDEKKKSSLERTLKTADEKLKKAKHDFEEVEKEVHGVDAQISAASGGKVKAIEKKVDDLTKQIKKISNEMSKLQHEINSSIKNAEKVKVTIEQAENEMRSVETNLQSLSDQKKQLTLENTNFEKELDEVEVEINEGSGEFTELKQEITKLERKEMKVKGERLEASKEVETVNKAVQDCKSKIPVWEREIKSLVLEDPGIEGVPGVEKPPPLVTHSAEELDEVEVEELRNRLAAQKGRLGDAKPNIQAIQDYKAKEELYIKRASELDEITTKRNEMRDLHDQLRKKRSTDFLCGFNTITKKLKEMYQMITLGGDAELELVDSLDPFTEGITFSVRPANKSWKNISNLSGGEKTLSSLALVFALHYYKPTPLYVMDEIDAALDFKNISIVANYIKERTKNAQFIIISLRNNMFEMSNRLVGIYKVQDCTRSVTIQNAIPALLPNEDVVA